MAESRREEKRRAWAKQKNKQSKTNMAWCFQMWLSGTQRHTLKNQGSTHTHTLLSGWPVAKQDVTKASRKKNPSSVEEGGARWSVPLACAHNQTKTLPWPSVLIGVFTQASLETTVSFCSGSDTFSRLFEIKGV